MLVELVQVMTSDGMVLHGALQRADGSGSSIALDAVLILHGAGGNFYNSPLLATIASTLQAAGVSVLRVNTRGHDLISLTRSDLGPQRQGATYENVGQCRYDVAAWNDLLVQFGYAKIGLVGHSLGAIKAVYATAAECCSTPEVIVAISPPRLAHDAFMRGRRRKLFEQTLARAQQHVDQGKPGAILHVKYPFPLLITAAGYLEKYGPAQRYDILRFAPQVPCPALYVFGEREVNSGSMAFAGLPDSIVSLEYNGPKPQCITVPDADHLYSGCERTLAGEVVAWLSKTI